MIQRIFIKTLQNLSNSNDLNNGNVVQVQTPMDDEVDIGQSALYQHGQFPRQDSASSALPAREAAAGFKGALKKVANGIAGGASLTTSVNMTAGVLACPG